MKAKELIEKLKGYEDFDIELTVCHEDADSIGWYTHKITGIADIGHSSKKIVLDSEVED